MTVHTQQLKKYISDSRPRFEDLLGQLVEVPSISMDPARAGEMPRAATLAVQYLKSLGADAQIVETGGYPIISGGWMTGAGYPTVTIYNHLDVQPAQEPELDEFTVVLDGAIDVEYDDGVVHVRAGQAVITRAGERVRYTTREGARYIAVCLPAFHGELVHREDEDEYDRDPVE